jgi:hypothetical protein
VLVEHRDHDDGAVEHDSEVVHEDLAAALDHARRVWAEVTGGRS